jgi:hypothetical protein
MSNKVYRQGDVLIKEVDIIPQKVNQLKDDNGRVVLAYGEATGHHHSLAVEDATLFENDVDGSRFLKLCRDSVLTHQEHDPINLPAGNYEVVIQREYSPEEIRRVVD